ncbi:MAG: hypothetical protein A3I05_07380 [Deltaproteobacteria bacterium RIFCSPLOWO2_02_FULL_44_10]|nr:MAG: hypothetical protein A3C46_01930 [Deltaproteobacteria bacterium RIFCSPHIGHO2_02_FULL_44_16]OGQ45656.1 MAG: hypothetical protein A3I05_07380 [Deltaproteobacteria bacterium RIFCSPLOWO2_02_FULL_44_10]
MKKVPLKELKENLSHWTEEAAGGEVIHITKHNRPYVELWPAGQEHLHVGKQIGKTALKPVLKEASSGKWLEVLQEDREEKSK